MPAPSGPGAQRGGALVVFVAVYQAMGWMVPSLFAGAGTAAVPIVYVWWRRETRLDRKGGGACRGARARAGRAADGQYSGGTGQPGQHRPALSARHFSDWQPTSRNNATTLTRYARQRCVWDRRSGTTAIRLAARTRSESGTFARFSSESPTTRGRRYSSGGVSIAAGGADYARSYHAPRADRRRGVHAGVVSRRRRFYTTPGGELLLLACGIVMLVGYWSMLKIGRVARPPRSTRSSAHDCSAAATDLSAVDRHLWIGRISVRWPGAGTGRPPDLVVRLRRLDPDAGGKTPNPTMERFCARWRGRRAPGRRVFGHLGSIAPGDLSRVLAQAGLGLKARDFYQDKVVTALGFEAILVVANLAFDKLGLLHVGVWPFWVWFVVGSVGFVWQDVVVRQAAKDRQKRLRAELPRLVDMLVVASSTGRGVQDAIVDVGTVLTGPLRHEWLRLTSQLTRGLKEPLMELAARNGLRDLDVLVGHLIVAYERGQGLETNLVQLSESLREQRLQELTAEGGRATGTMFLPVGLPGVPATARGGDGAGRGHPGGAAQ